MIALALVAEFTVEEISNILGEGKTPDIDREMLLTKATELYQTIQKLTAMGDGLQHTAACIAPRHSECHRFRR